MINIIDILGDLAALVYKDVIHKPVASVCMSMVMVHLFWLMI